jgi:ABC-2 type transport system permease protein
VLILLWTVGYWLCFGITYGYNAYFWDNAIAKSLTFSMLCWWIFGLLVIALVVLFSTVSTANTGVLLGTGGVVLVSYLLSMLPKISKYLPTHLTDGNSLIYGVAQTGAYTAALIISAVTALACFVGGLVVFNKKQL